jgi:hypothetical protein
VCRVIVGCADVNEPLGRALACCACMRRARLSYEAFSRFLAAIKDLNAGRSSRDETLRFVRELCGAPHADLYALFEGLLSRHMMTGSGAGGL